MPEDTDVLAQPDGRGPRAPVTRRKFVAVGTAGAALFPCATALGARAAADATDPTASLAAAAPGLSAAPGAGLDLDDPGQHLHAYVRMRGSTDGRLVVDVTQGFVYALLPNGRPRLLLQSRGVQLARYRRADDGAWVCRSSYFGTFADPRSGAPLEQWDNPVTQRRDTVPSTLYGPSDYVLTASRTLVNPTPAQRAQALAERAVRRWTRIGDLVTLLDELGPPDDPARPADLDLVSLSARVADLADASLESVPSQMAFNAVEPWREWMRMDSRPGMLWWHLQGTKVDGLGQAPAELLRAAEARRPGFVEQASK